MSLWLDVPNDHCFEPGYAARWFKALEDEAAAVDLVHQANG